MLKIFINENYEIPKSTYEYCLKNFMYPNYNKVPKGTIYHNTHLEYVDAIAHNGILISKAKQLEYSGNMTWATTLPNQKGYGGCTVAFTLDGLEDRYDYEMVNNTEYCIYKDIPAKNIIFIDLPVVDGSGIGLTRLSDIPELIEEYGLEKVQKVFNKYGDKYIPLEDILPYIQLNNSIKESITLKHDKSTHFTDSDDLDYHYYDIMKDGVRVGTIEIIDCFNEDNDICYVDRIDIDDEYQNQGIGTNVLTKLLQELGYWKVVVAPDSTDAERLYKRIGEPLNSCYLNTEVDFGYNDQGYGVYII